MRPLLVLSLIFTLALRVASSQAQSFNPNGQSPSQSTERYSVQGSVVNSLTGEPIRRALVQLNGIEAHSAFTGPDGRFQIEGVAAGTFAATAQRPGFQDGSQFRRGPSPTMITIGPNSHDVLIKLLPLGSISGRVLDSDQQPVPNLQVQCFQRVIVSGRKQWQQIRSVQTDDNGDFLIDNLPEGPYLIEAQEKAVYPGQLANDEFTRLVYPSQFFPNSPDMNSAQPVTVRAGGDTRADVSVSAVRGTRVYFSVIPHTAWVMPTLENANGEQIQTGVQLTSGRNWILPSVPPGTWKLIAYHQDQSGTQLYGEVPLEVGTTDLHNVQLVLAPLPSIPVTVSRGMSQTDGVREPDSAPVPRPAVNVQLTPASQSGSWSQTYWTQPDPSKEDGSILISGVRPGTYRVSVVSSGQGCVESVTSGSTDLARNNLVVTAGSTAQPINVTVGTDCASLEISVNQGETQEPVTILVIGDPQTEEPHNGSAVSGGKITIPNLSPGDYQAFAFSGANEVEYANPEVLRSFSGQHVTLSANGKASITLDVNPPVSSQ